MGTHGAPPARAEKRIFNIALMILKCLLHARSEALTLLTGKALPKFQMTVSFSSS